MTGVETLEQAEIIIYRELISEDAEIRADYSRLFDGRARAFSAAMAQAIVAWQTLDRDTIDGNRQYVWALVHAAITLQILSLKLLLSGHIIAAGNIFRQVVESIALALLCSKKDLDVLQRFVDDQYSSSHAVRDVVRHWQKLGLIEGAQHPLRDAVDHYHKYSHITRLTLAQLIPSSGAGAYVGASFDPGRIDAYKKEVEGRVSLAAAFVSFIAGVKKNLND